MFYGFPCPFGFNSEGVNRYKAWWWKLILIKMREAGAQSAA